MLIFTFKLFELGFAGVDVTGVLADNLGDALMLSYGYCLLPLATLML